MKSRLTKSPGNLIIVSAPDPASRRKMLRLLSGGRFSWAYFGQDVIEMSEVAADIGQQATFLDTAKRFHETSEELRSPFLTELYRTGRDLASLRWWITSISQRSGILSKSFHQSCLLKSALDLAQSWAGPEPLVLMAPGAVRRALKTNLRNDQDIRLKVTEPVRPVGPRYLVDVGRMLLRRLYFVARECHRIRTARQILPTLPRTSGPTSVLLSWATPHNIHLRDQFHQSFFGDLANGLEKLGHPVAIAPIVVRDIDYRSALGQLDTRPRPFLPPHRFLTYGDVFRAAISTFKRPPRPHFTASFRGIDIRSITDEDLRAHWISNAAADAMLIPPLIRRWASLGFQIERFIYIFENQPFERAICWEARRSFPEASVVGFQHAGTPRFWLNVHLAPEGEPEAPLPDWIVTNGAYTAGILLENGHCQDSLALGGALQMHDFVEQLTSTGPPGPADGVPTILVAPSDGLEEAAELTFLTASLFDSSQSVRLILKYHPQMPLKLRGGIGRISLPENVEVRDEPILSLMAQSSILVYSGSTVAVQALALGLPAIHVKPRFDLDRDPLDAAKDLRLEAMGLDDLREKVLWLLANREEYIKQNETAWKSLAQSIYGPVTEDTYRAFVGPVSTVPQDASVDLKAD